MKPTKLFLTAHLNNNPVMKKLWGDVWSELTNKIYFRVRIGICDQLRKSKI